ncbi:MAG: HAD hydrolase family protein [Gemmataceae bacterium]|nr:HAD hydrolase family protein [Gemmataceae bacterium]
MTPALADRLRPIEALILDVDGVLTDGTIIYSDAGQELQSFHVRDGSGLALWRRAGRKTAVISGRGGPALERRATELGLAPVFMRVKDKGQAVADAIAQLGLEPRSIAAVGDDLPDFPVFRAVGARFAVADACPEIRSAADVVLQARGGRGAVREAIEYVLKAQGTWQRWVDSY